MKSLFLAVAMVLGLVSAAQAATPTPVSEVTVSIGLKLQAKADKYGQKELDMLARDLKQDVERALARCGSIAPEGAVLHLVIAEAVPNRPTFKQLNDRIGLSMESVGVGGATIEGDLAYPDGQTQSVAYRWYESDIRQALGSWTWTDATWTFQQFANRMASGKACAAR